MGGSLETFPGAVTGRKTGKEESKRVYLLKDVRKPGVETTSKLFGNGSDPVQGFGTLVWNYWAPNYSPSPSLKEYHKARKLAHLSCVFRGPY